MIYDAIMAPRAYEEILTTPYGARHPYGEAIPIKLLDQYITSHYHPHEDAEDNIDNISIAMKPIQLSRAHRQYLRQHPDENFIAVARINGKEEYFTNRSSYIHRLDEVWCTACTLSFAVLRVEDSQSRERLHDKH